MAPSRIRRRRDLRRLRRRRRTGRTGGGDRFRPRGLSRRLLRREPSGSAKAARSRCSGARSTFSTTRRLAEVEPRAAPLRALRIVDDTGSLFAPPPVEFRAREIGRDAFGWNIENAALADVLEAAAAARPIRSHRGRRRRVRFRRPSAPRVTLADGRVFAAGWSSAPTGAVRRAPRRRDRRSVRTLSPERADRLPRPRRPHEDFSTEFHTREGPFTLVPLPARPARRIARASSG